MKTSFTEGPVHKQLFTMLFASWVAMTANMLLSLVDMFFLSRLEDIDVLAAIGFSSSISMFAASIGIGFSVSTSVLVSQKLTRNGKLEASQLFSAIVLMGSSLSAILVIFLLAILPLALDYLGASGQVYIHATDYLTLILISSPLAVLSMIFAAGLRAAAMAKASMWVSLIATVVNIILDPIFIEVLGWGIKGAAWASVIARLTAFLAGIWYLACHLKWIKPVSWHYIKNEFPKVQRITLPVLMTNLVTPIGGLIVVAVIADYGNEAMAGLAVVGSITPILFSVYFSLSGAAGPMVGQNIGANKPQRIAAIYQTGLATIIGYTLLIWFISLLALPLLIQLFHLKGLPADLLTFYCKAQIPLSAGLGLIALSNGIFNNLKKPRWSMWLNISRATIATWAFCTLGNWLFGLYGAVIASSLTFTCFGLLAVYLATRLFHTHYPEYRLLLKNADAL